MGPSYISQLIDDALVQWNVFLCHFSSTNNIQRNLLVALLESFDDVGLLLAANHCDFIRCD